MYWVWPAVQETCPDVDAALALYTAKRMVGGPGVTIPSQIRCAWLCHGGWVGCVRVHAAQRVAAGCVRKKLTY